MSMTIWQRALELYEQYDTGRALEEDVGHYLREGYVFSTPDYLIMGERSGDGWVIYLAVGPGCLTKFVALMPYYLPYIGWARRGGKVCWYDTEKLIMRINQMNRRKL